MARPATAAPARIDALDLLRGVGITLMILYHLSWDLSFFGYAEVDLFNDPFWLAARTFIVSIFLVSSGISYALARRTGIDPQKFLNRFSRILAAAIVVTIATATVFQEGIVFFGILHNLAIASLLIVVFAGLPYWAVALCGAAVIFLGLDVNLSFFDIRQLAWIGFAANPPFSIDYVPIFPWFGATLMGFAFMQLLLGSPGIMRQLEGWKPEGRIPDLLRWMGRKTLLIYLIHQPILFGALWVLDKISVR